MPDDEDVALRRRSTTQNQLDRVTGMVDRLPDHASLETGGSRQGDKGYFYAPTVVSGLQQDDEAIQDEIFGPGHHRAAVHRRGTRRCAGPTACSTAWPPGVDQGPRPRDADGQAASTSACVWINTHIPIVAEMPHGGFKHSGYGKDLSMYGLEDYTRIKHVMSYIGE